MPDVALAPLHAPDAVHEVALVVDHDKVEDEPDVIDVGEAEIVTVGGGITTLFTVTETDEDVAELPAASLATAVKV